MEGMALVDLNDNLIFINNAWCEMHGYKSYKELLGKNLAIFHTKEQFENDVIPFNEKVKENGTYSGEVGHVTKEGKPFPTLMTTTILKDDKGKPYGIAGIAKDITTRKQEERIQMVIYNISNAVTTTNNLDDLYKNIHQQLGNILNVTNFYIANYNEQTDEIFSRYFIDDNAEIKVHQNIRKNGLS
jgi:PAS domain S-box-containing protein